MISQNDKNDWIKTEFRRRHRIFWAISLPTICAMILMAGLGMRYEKVSIFDPVLGPPMWILVGLTLLGTVVSSFFWKCPSCNRFLGSNVIYPKECPKCKVQLR